jgi:hypothetical protein
MTPDEVVSKEIEAIENILYSDLNLSEGTKQALQSAISLIQDYQKLREKIDRLRIQLAVCGVAALGYATGKNAIEKGSYGYSVSFQDVVDLWDKYQKLRERIDVATLAFQFYCLDFPDIDKQELLADWQGYSERLRMNYVIKAQSIVTYLQQPTEH